MGKVKINEIFNTNYVIPCFQREYSWDVKEIEELIDDIIDSKEEYCIGVVTIKSNHEIKELIDGQQRLTTLYLIAIACNYISNSDEIKLKYETDDLLNKKNKIKLLLDNSKNENNILKEKYNSVLEIVEQYDKDIIRDKLNNIYFYEIDISSQTTDLNHYFEVMNSRGVQLCRSDIIKSYLMNFLENDDKKRLNNLWNSYESMNIKKYKSYDSIKSKTSYKEKTIIEILSSKKNNIKKIEELENNNDNSILDFDYFLLYTIRLYRKIKLNIKDDNKMFDLKDLVNDYRKTFKGKSDKEVKKFLDFMIEIKNIYDSKIIKSTRGNEEDNWTIDIKNYKKDIIMIQSCIRVSITNRRQMKWLFETLEYFYNDGKISDYVNYIRKFVRENYIKDFLQDAKNNNYSTGFDTPRIVLNYLDYLIYANKDKLYNDIKEINNINFKNFTFKFRNSLEHFLPRENEDKISNKDWVDDFGNLALLAYGTNTKMQNANPENKADYFKNNLQEYSLKLQIMTKRTLENDKGWNKEDCIKLRNIFISILEKDLNEN